MRSVKVPMDACIQVHAACICISSHTWLRPRRDSCDRRSAPRIWTGSSRPHPARRERYRPPSTLEEEGGAFYSSARNTRRACRELIDRPGGSRCDISTRRASAVLALDLESSYVDAARAAVRYIRKLGAHFPLLPPRGAEREGERVLLP